MGVNPLKEMKKMAMLDTMINVGAEYHPHDQLEERELEHLAIKADEQLSTMNGDTGRIEISVRQAPMEFSFWLE